MSQRGGGRAEKLICDAKNTGRTNLPSAGMAINTAWLTTALIAHDLLAWSRRLVFGGGDPNQRESSLGSL